MDYDQVAKKIVEAVGGKKNISYCTHCATRIRLTLADNKLADLDKAKRIKGVIDVICSSGQVQFVIGVEVGHVYEAIEKLGLPSKTGGAPKEEQKTGNLFSRAFSLVANSFSPIIPVIISAGMLKAVLAILKLCGLPAEAQTYQIISFVADTGFYFFPVFIAASAAKILKTNVFLAAAVGAVLIHPNFIALVKAGNPLSIFGFLPVPLVSYSSAIIPSILAAWFLSKVEPFIQKIIPKIFRYFLCPLLTFFIVTLATLTVFGPIGYWCGYGLGAACEFLRVNVPWVLPVLIGGLNPLLVITGMHWALSPLSMQSYATYGYEAIAGPGNFVSNISEGAAALAVSIKTKNKALKQESFTAGITAVLCGITEPALYAVNLKLKKPLYACLIGGAVGGLFMGLTGVVKYVAGTPGLISSALYIGANPMNIVYALIAVVISFVVTFGLTFLFGFEDIPEEESEMEDSRPMEQKPLAISVPVKGEIIRLQNVKDKAIASGSLGSGIAVIPSEGEIFAPFDGEVSMMFHTGHAVTVKNAEGLELFIHVGIDTVELDGKYFEMLVTKGDKIREGQSLIKFDIDAIKKAGYDTTVSVILANDENVSKMKVDVVQSGSGNKMFVTPSELAAV
ncbi:MAG: PTS beta-glucoside transporter subunit EIIBCA [Ruminococcaceae bacterium]|nr:PTS beta-glucoside transporter subunit EIIBCA [Oscillospiraceae bacterium]